MAACRILDGLNIAPRSAKEARALRGKAVRYLKDVDIDTSGRGYFFPRSGIVDGAYGREICIDGDYVAMRRIVEMVEIV
jgi:hypothetical protein